MKPTCLTREELRRQFADPPPEFGLYPCWWWEGQRVTKEKITWQLEEMKKAGTFGTFFYLRYGGEEPFAVTPAYGTNEFLDLFRFSLEEHRRLGMEAYFSEWTGQHSIADQIHADPAAYERLTGARLVLHAKASETAGLVQVEIPIIEEVLCAAAYRMIPGGLDWESRVELNDRVENGLLKWHAPESGWLLTVVSSRKHGLNYLDHELTDYWIENLWKPYLDRMSEFVGSTFKGYVQDELDVLSGDILYSDVLRERFEKDNGYDPRPWLVSLFHDIGPLTDTIRCGYYAAVAGLLEENMYARLSQWHEKRGMYYGTVAVRGRQDILAQTGHFCDLFKLLRWYHFPGNEDPHVEPTIPARRRFIDAKLSSSAAHIFERQRAAVCAYWGTGWGLTMEQRLSWTNENYAYGLNLYDPHLAQMGLAGGWYEWVPPAQYFYHPYWQLYKTFSDYVRRLSFILSQGVHRAGVAILFPTVSIHANWIGGNRYTLAADLTACTTYNIADSLYRGGIDFDFIDEDSLDRADVHDNALHIAGLTIEAIVLPPMTTVRLATLQKLQRLYEAGGIVVAFQQLPHASAENGRDDPKVRAILKTVFGIAASSEYTHATFQGDEVHESHFRHGVTEQPNETGGVSMFVPGEQNRGMNASACDLPSVLRGVMTPDVQCLEKDVFHTHQRIGDQDIYFLYNARPQQRELTFTFRIDGEPEIWNATTGKISPWHRFEHREKTTKVRLRMERNEGVIINFSESSGRAGVLEDNLTDIDALEPSGESVGEPIGEPAGEPVNGLSGTSGEKYVRVRGKSDTGGRKYVRLQYSGREYVGETRQKSPPQPIYFGSKWGIRLKPTMDNRWGDYRYPASPDLLGAEARRFKYMEEGAEEGMSLGWHRTDYDDSCWPQYTYSFGPYWFVSEPLRAEEEQHNLPEKIFRADISPEITQQNSGDTVLWRRYDFSQQFGHESKDVHQGDSGLAGVADHFIVFEKLGSQCDYFRYLLTTVCTLEAGEWDLVMGGRNSFPHQAWINGQQVEDTIHTQTRTRVKLKPGPNKVLLKMVQQQGRALWAYAVFLPPGVDPLPGRPPVPRLRWFLQPNDLVFDILLDAAGRIGWYRFEAPAGLRALRLALDARGVKAWVNGEAVEVKKDRIELDSPVEDVSQIALRIEQKPGRYGGAAFTAPVVFECGQGQAELGDWCDYALESYSGGAVYSREFALEPHHLECRIRLDLGKVNTCAEVRVNNQIVGTGLARPFHFDITEYVRVGANNLEVTVYNTLANHYSIGIPSQYVYEGQTVSGLLGPVCLQFLETVTLKARIVNYQNTRGGL